MQYKGLAACVKYDIVVTATMVQSSHHFKLFSFHLPIAIYNRMNNLVADMEYCELDPADDAEYAGTLDMEVVHRYNTEPYKRTYNTTFARSVPSLVEAVKWLTSDQYPPDDTEKEDTIEVEGLDIAYLALLGKLWMMKPITKTLTFRPFYFSREEKPQRLLL